MAKKPTPPRRGVAPKPAIVVGGTVARLGTTAPKRRGSPRGK